MRNQVNERELANEIAAVRFAMIDLGMYLDTHPECEGALRLYAEYNRKYGDLCAAYVSHFGPLRMGDVCGGHGWTWGVDDFAPRGGC